MDTTIPTLTDDRARFWSALDDIDPAATVVVETEVHKHLGVAAQWASTVGCVRGTPGEIHAGIASRCERPAATPDAAYLWESGSSSEARRLWIERPVDAADADLPPEDRRVADRIAAMPLEELPEGAAERMIERARRTEIARAALAAVGYRPELLDDLSGDLDRVEDAILDPGARLENGAASLLTAAERRRRARLPEVSRLTRLTCVLAARASGHASRGMIPGGEDEAAYRAAVDRGIEDPEPVWTADGGRR